MGKNIIELNEVWKVFNIGDVEVAALRGLNFSVKHKEFVAVQGPSGSGKSTTFSLIGCLDFPSKGKVYLEGKDITKLDENTLAKIRGKKIGFIFQSFNLVPTLTAVENVILPALFQNQTKEQVYDKAINLLNMVGLSHRIDHKPNQMSGGEKQRVAIARALINDPEVILADEPTGNLDSKTGEIIMKMLTDLNKKHGRTIVMVTHEKSIAAYADRTVFIRDGRVSK